MVVARQDASVSPDGQGRLQNRFFSGQTEELNRIEQVRFSAAVGSGDAGELAKSEIDAAQVLETVDFQSSDHRVAKPSTERGRSERRFRELSLNGRLRRSERAQTSSINRQAGRDMETEPMVRPLVEDVVFVEEREEDVDVEEGTHQRPSSSRSERT